MKTAFRSIMLDVTAGAVLLIVAAVLAGQFSPIVMAVVSANNPGTFAFKVMTCFRPTGRWQ